MSFMKQTSPGIMEDPGERRFVFVVMAIFLVNYRKTGYIIEMKKKNTNKKTLLSKCANNSYNKKRQYVNQSL